MAVQSYGHGARTPPAPGRWTFEQLFVNGRRATQRTPNEFYQQT